MNKTLVFFVVVAAIAVVAYLGLRPRTILVGTASYGMNAAANNAGNYTQAVSSQCNKRKGSCNFQGIGGQGDPAPGVKKDFSWSWSCTGPIWSSEEKRGYIAPEAVGQTATLTCP